jgi:hypothetical protein
MDSNRGILFLFGWLAQLALQLQLAMWITVSGDVHVQIQCAFVVNFINFAIIIPERTFALIVEMLDW